LQKSFISLRDKFEDAGLKWCIFAGGAAHAYGSSRAITDIDILVKKSDLPKAEALGLSTDGRHVSFDSIDVVFELEIPVEGNVLRFFMDEEMEKRLRSGKLFGLTVPLVPLEDNIILKAILGRGPEQGKFDIQDICDMARNPIDRDYLQRRISFYKVGKIVLPLLSKLAIL